EPPRPAEKAGYCSAVAEAAVPAACGAAGQGSLVRAARGTPVPPRLRPVSAPPRSADFCYLPSVCGNCKALFVRFFYNASSRRCEEFIYGGCGGNRNNFETEGECSQACSHVGN
uniref:BPTI/Kunitz inhibitor domain-containing protein n=1 Tax=Dromaius novaehollandiae TaxID=8790 RepID=A0A8C4P5Q1_DRONO